MVLHLLEASVALHCVYFRLHDVKHQTRAPAFVSSRSQLPAGVQITARFIGQALGLRVRVEDLLSRNTAPSCLTFGFTGFA